ncbi:MAG TPA: bifunctional helix-turn-helix domain-containing protein/methylated-DNA--[protein]-cysteine S-methyltransferase [Steroidobacteraceae bacterium]|nr:bifunctional helix-turn-helix domain-containing protein/methylated-DNA--[protein]-cysteine S-methyltransferase [Gammaproteobacteria bacterium]HEV2286164.1 bifunctional helix-turn-helix domain-containing protein/methylated-DNA--[protein]-cysteine S-methyltransferase [Steroidobacteraceae bacterium]
MQTSTTSFIDSRDFRRIARAIRFIDAHYREQPRLAAIAAHAGLSEFHFNRLFRRWAGVTPRQYLAYVTARAARGVLGHAASVLEASYAVGLSGPGRLHDLLVTLDAVTPGELKAQGAGLEIRYGFTPTPFGTALIASTTRGICHLGFHDRGSEHAAAGALAAQWSRARLVRSDESARTAAAGIFAAQGAPRAAPLRLAVRGTNFQLKVWQALLEVGAHGPTTYAEVALAAGVPGSERAVGNAVGANRIAWLIPCHNVLRADGSLGGYRWGEERKRAMLAFEARDIIQRAPQASPRLPAGRSVSA